MTCHVSEAMYVERRVRADAITRRVVDTTACRYYADDGCLVGQSHCLNARLLDVRRNHVRIE